ncbi:MAG: hypothetical protein PHU63_03705 [Candidatus ainarchaeum sp.]|nr:hypothetical protein [Candidatus ainarchaeum sp.]
MEELIFSAKYPFSKTSKKILEESGISLSPQIISSALLRIRNSLKGTTSKISALKKEDYIQEISNYAASRMILSCMNNSYLTNKFAVSEAKRAYSYLNYEPEETISTLSEEFNFKIKKSEDKYFVHFSTYLKHSPGSLDYRLINRDLHHGYIIVNKHELLRLLQEAIRDRVQNIPLLKTHPREIKEAANSLFSELPKITTTKITFKKGDNPPCIESLLISLKKHHNLNHQSRWYLAVYLINKKMSTEDILDLFSNFPDFKEKTSKYQIEHAKKQGYMVPSCATIRGYGLCTANCNIKNPLSWKFKREKTSGKNER